MNKFFALSLLMLSSSIIYACHNHAEKSCCTPEIKEEKKHRCPSELKKFAVDVDVELKLPDDFKKRLVVDSETKFTVNLGAGLDAVAHPIFGLNLKGKDENLVVEAHAGKGEIGKSQYWINLVIDRTNDLHWVNIRLYSEFKKRLLNLHSHVSERVSIAEFMSLKAATLKMPEVGDGLDIYDETFKPDTIEVAIAAHAVGEGVALTEEEIAQRNDSKLINLTEPSDLNLSHDSQENVQEDNLIQEIDVRRAGISSERPAGFEAIAK